MDYIQRLTIIFLEMRIFVSVNTLYSIVFRCLIIDLKSSLVGYIINQNRSMDQYRDIDESYFPINLEFSINDSSIFRRFFPRDRESVHKRVSTRAIMVALHNSLSPWYPFHSVLIHFLLGSATARGSQLHSISKNNLCIFEIYLWLRARYTANAYAYKLPRTCINRKVSMMLRTVVCGLIHVEIDLYPLHGHNSRVSYGYRL